MGELNLQDGAIVYVDSAIFIYTLQSEQKYFSILNVFWAKFQSREIENKKQIGGTANGNANNQSQTD